MKKKRDNKKHLKVKSKNKHTEKNIHIIKQYA